MEIITTHKNSDFDAVASVFAAARHYPTAMAVLPKSINLNVRRFLSIHKDHFPFFSVKDIDLEEAEKLIVVDTNRMTSLEGFAALMEKSDLEVHLWDHHVNKGDIKADWACCDPVGATTTLLIRFLAEEKARLSPIQATLFLAGIYEDTGHLTFPATTAEDARAVGFLLEQHADLNIIKNFLRPLYGPRQKDVLFEMLKNSERIKIDGYHVSLNKVNIEGHTPGLSLVVDMYRDIVNVDAAFGIFVEAKRDRCMVIGRSDGDSLDIGSIMRRLGGGGHPNAGSVLLKSVKPDVLDEWILELIKGEQKTSVQISDLMSYPVYAVQLFTSMKEVAALLREKGCTGIPVLEGEKVVGIISRRDFKKVKKTSQMTSPVKAYMSTDVIQVSPGSSVFQAARLMIKNDIGRLPVVENGRLIGIITRSDTMRYYYDMLPE